MNRAIGIMDKVLANGPGDRRSIPVNRVAPKSQKLVFDATLLSTQHYNVRIKSKVEQFRQWMSVLPKDLCVVAIETEAFRSPSNTVPNLIVFIRLYGL